MALQKIIEVEGEGIIKTPFGQVKSGKNSTSFLAYIKVTGISGNKNQVHASVSFSNKEAEFSKSYVVPMSIESGSENFIKQVYEYLKTLPEFDGAQDC